ncbi:MAG: peptidoglycan recognition family protein [Planctomycetota bacterium]
MPEVETSPPPTRPEASGLLELEGRGTLSVLRRSAWGSRAAVPSRLDPMGQIFRLTVHHSAMVVGDDRQEAAEQIRSIQRRHIGANHWGDIGYHFLIARDGSVFEGRELEWQGAHAGDGRTNRGNIGICLLGQYKADEPGAQVPTRAQVRALVQLTCSLCEHYDIGPDAILTHREIHPTHATECPGEQVSALVKRLRTELRLRNRAE